MPRSTIGRRAVVVAVFVASVQSASGLAQSTGADQLGGGDYLDENTLAELLWAQAPEVLDARTLAGVAASEVTRAHTYPNPNFDFTWGTIPIGRTNPPGLQDPLVNVPNYNA